MSIANLHGMNQNTSRLYQNNECLQSCQFTITDTGEISLLQLPMTMYQKATKMVMIDGCHILPDVSFVGVVIKCLLQNKLSLKDRNKQRNSIPFIIIETFDYERIGLPFFHLPSCRTVPFGNISLPNPSMLPIFQSP
jgi:hypothetical protein